MSWFYAKHGKSEGPVEESELRAKIASGEIGPDNLVWRQGMAEWTPLGKVSELAPGQAPGAVPPPAPPVEAAPPDAPATAPMQAPGSAPDGPVSPAPGGAPAPAAMLQNQPPPGMPTIAVPPPTSGLAIASLVCGIMSLMVCYVWALVGIPAVICGHMALKQIGKADYAMSGRGMAIAGLVTGYLACLIQVLAIIGFVVLLNAASNGVPTPP